MKSVFLCKFAKCNMSIFFKNKKQQTAQRICVRGAIHSQTTKCIWRPSSPLPASLPSQTAKRIWRPSSNTSGITPQPNSKAHLASVPPTLPASLPSQTAKRIWRPSLPTSPGSHTLPGGCPPRGPRRGNVNRGMKSLNRYAPLGAHL